VNNVSRKQYKIAIATSMFQGLILLPCLIYLSTLRIENYFLLSQFFLTQITILDLIYMVVTYFMYLSQQNLTNIYNEVASFGDNKKSQSEDFISILNKKVLNSAILRALLMGVIWIMLNKDEYAYYKFTETEIEVVLGK